MATQALLPLPRQVFCDANGIPLAGGLVHTYIPGGTTPKTTWQDSGAATPNANPIVLDAAGSCLIYGSGNYQLTVTDADGVSCPGFSGVTASFGGQTPNISFGTIALLRANAVTPNASVAWVTGYVTAGDGGEGMFYLNASDTTTADNNGTIIVDAAGNRWYREWQGANLQLLWFGGSGASDFSVLLNRALLVVTTLSASKSGMTIAFPAQTMTFQSKITWTYPAGTPFSLTFTGAGSDASVLNWSSTDGMQFNLLVPGHSIHMLDMTISTDAVGTQTGIYVHQATALGVYDASDFTRVTWRGSSMSATAGWAVAAKLTCLCAYNVVGCSVWGALVAGVKTGTGFVCQGDAAVTNQFSVIQNFTDTQFTFLNEAITYGDYLQGMTLSQVNITEVTNGIHQHAGSGAVGIGAQLALNNCQVACDGFGVEIEGVIGDILISGTLFYSRIASGASVFCTVASNVDRLTITGSSFEGANVTGTQAIVLAGTCAGYTIVGNVIYGLVTGINNAAGSTTQIGSITGNIIQAINTTTLGITLAGNNQYIAITGNTFFLLGTAVNLGAASGHINVQSNVYGSCLNNVTNTGAGNTVGGGSP
jgi:hypothetical protein